MKENILLIHNFYQIPGGEDTVVDNERKMLEKNGHKVIFYSRNNAELKEQGIFFKAALPVIAVFNPRTFFDVRRIIKRERIDIVHVHNTMTLISPSVFYAAWSMGVPVVNTVHNFRLECASAVFYRDGNICEDCLHKGDICALKHKCYRNSFLQTLVNVGITNIHRLFGTYRKINFICLTEFNKKKLLEMNRKHKRCIDPKKVFVKPNFTFEPNPILSKESLTKDYYLYIGRMEKIKGVDKIVKAFEINQKKIIMVGDGTDYKKVKQYVEKKNLENIVLTGYVERTKIEEYLSHAKALIVDSQWYETFGMVVIEAYANHVPVIVGDIGNIGDLVLDKKTGRKFKYNSVKDLNRVIEEFEDEPVSGDAGYQHFFEKYSENSNYKQLINIYNSIQ